MPYKIIYRSKTDGLAHEARDEHHTQCGQRLGDHERVGGDNPLSVERTCAVCFPGIGKAQPRHQVVYIAQYCSCSHEGSIEILHVTFDKEEADQVIVDHRESELHGMEPRKSESWFVLPYEVGGHVIPRMNI